MLTMTELKTIAASNGFTVGTFCTNGANYYQDAVLWVGVGSPASRRSHLVLAHWDVSYSLRSAPTENNKLGRAVLAAREYILEHAAPDPAELVAEEAQRRLRSRAAARKRRHETQTARRAEQNTLLAKLVPTTLREVAPRLDLRVLKSFGIDAAEHETLLDESGLVALLDDQPLVKQATTAHGLGWYTIYAKPTDAPVIPLATAGGKPLLHL